MTFLFDIAVAAADAFEPVLGIEPQQVCPAFPLEHARVELPFITGQHEYLHLAAGHFRERGAVTLWSTRLEHDFRHRSFVRQAGVSVQVQRHDEEQTAAHANSSSPISALPPAARNRARSRRWHASIRNRPPKMATMSAMASEFIP